MVANDHVHALVRNRMERSENAQTSADSLIAGHRVDLNTDPLGDVEGGEKLSAGAPEVEHGVFRSDESRKLLAVEDTREATLALYRSRVARSPFALVVRGHHLLIWCDGACVRFVRHRFLLQLRLPVLGASAGGAGANGRFPTPESLCPPRWHLAPAVAPSPTREGDQT